MYWERKKREEIAEHSIGITLAQGLENGLVRCGRSWDYKEKAIDLMKSPIYRDPYSLSYYAAADVGAKWMMRFYVGAEAIFSTRQGGVLCMSADLSPLGIEAIIYAEAKPADFYGEEGGKDPQKEGETDADFLTRATDELGMSIYLTAYESLRDSVWEQARSLCGYSGVIKMATPYELLDRLLDYHCSTPETPERTTLSKIGEEWRDGVVRGDIE